MALGKTNGSVFASRERLLSGRAFRSVEVEIAPGEKLRLRHLTGQEVVDYFEEDREHAKAVEEAKQNGGAVEESVAERNVVRWAEIICKLAIDEHGERVLKDDDAEGLVKSLSASTLSGAFLKVVQATNAEMTAMGEK